MDFLDKTKIKVLRSADKKRFRQRAIMVGILRLVEEDLRSRLQSWVYYEGKKRIVKGKKYNLFKVRVRSSEYTMRIRTNAIFLIDASHLRSKEKIKIHKEIERWSGFSSSIPREVIATHKDMYFEESKSMYITDLLEQGTSELEYF